VFRVPCSLSPYGKTHPYFKKLSRKIARFLVSKISPATASKVEQKNKFSSWSFVYSRQKIGSKMEIVKSRQNKVSGASVLFNTKDNDGKTPAHHAVCFSTTVF